MNQIQPRDRITEETARIREVVARHPLPSDGTGFEITLGELDGDLAMWFVFGLRDEPEPEGGAFAVRMKALAARREQVGRDLLDTIEDRFPYFRFMPERAAQK